MVAQIFRIFPGKQNYFWNTVLMGWRESYSSFHLNLLTVVLTPSIKEQLLNISFPTIQSETREATIEWLHHAIGPIVKVTLIKILYIT